MRQVAIGRYSSITTMYLVSGKDSMEKVDGDPLHNITATADYSVYDSLGAKETSGKLKISGHGNSTWTELMEEFPGQEFKRSYNISFNEKKSILGMKSAGNYVLLSNFYDESELKNYLVLDMARRIGVDNVPDCEYKVVQVEATPFQQELVKRVMDF